MPNRYQTSTPDAQRLGDTGETLGFALTRAWMRFHQAYSDALEPLKLTPSRTLALAYVVHNPGSDQSALAAALGINKASAMGAVDRLTELRYVNRQSGADRRSNALLVTAIGRQAYAEAMRLEAQVERELLGRIGARDIGSLRRILAAIGSESR